MERIKKMKDMKTLQRLPYLIGSTSDGKICIYCTSDNTTINVNDLLFGYHNQED